jgi:hypothetical protein
VTRRRVTDVSIISVEEAVGALRRSGYLLEDRIDAFLRSKNYLTTANAAYPDPTTGKSRETDINAFEMFFESQEEAMWGVFHELLIECVNNPQPVAFITKDRKGRSSGVESQIRPTSILLGPQDEETGQVESGEVAKLFEVSKFHYASQGRVATQYCTFQKKQVSRPREDGKGATPQEEWMAFHDDHHFDTFRKLFDAVEYSIQTFGDVPQSKHPVIGLFYPVLVLQGGLLEVQQDGTEVTGTPVDHIRFRQAVHSGGKQVTHQIDVVTEAYFPNLVKLMEQSARELQERLAVRLFSKDKE